MTNTLFNPYVPFTYLDRMAPIETKKSKSGLSYLYCVGTYNLKSIPMRPCDYGILYAGKKCHNYKNKRN